MVGWNRYADGSLCAEPLEGRCLLSGVVFPTFEHVDGRFAVMEEEEELEEEEDVEVAVGDLPEAVRAALREALGGAKVMEAEFGIDDGAAEYGVVTRYEGRTLELTLTPQGKIIEMEEVMAADELPRGVLESLYRRFPGAEIEEAVVMVEGDQVSYEVSVATRDGREVDATFQRAGDSEPTRFSDESRIEESAPSRSIASDSVVSSDQVEAVITTSEPGWVVGSGEGESIEPPLALPARQLDEALQAAVDVAEASALVDGVRLEASKARAALPGVMMAGVAMRWEPEMGEVISALTPEMLRDLEERLARILEQIEAMVEAEGSVGVVRTGVLALLAAAALVAGVQLLLDSRKSRGGPMLVFSPGNSSWSWAMGSARSRRG